MNEDLLIQKITGLEEDVKIIKEKINKVDLIDDVLAGQDKMIQILMRVDQERLFTNERMKRLEEDVQRIKLHLQLA